MLQSASKDREVIQDLIKGKTYEDIAKDHGISTKDAFEMARAVLTRWTKEFALDLVEARELDSKRLDAILVMLSKELEPKPKIDGEGKPIFDPFTGDPVMESPNLAVIKTYLDVLERRSKLHGLDTQRKVEMDRGVEVIERRYVGVKVENL